MTQTIKKLYTVEEYFALEELAEDKNEYSEGAIISMTGASINHQRIAKNIFVAISNAFSDRDCEAFISEMKIQVKAGKYYSYPDVAALCGEVILMHGRTDTIVNPSLIVEVLSKSTQTYDKGEKFEAYQALDSLQDYLLVNQYKLDVKYYHKQADNTWSEETFGDVSQTITLKAVNVELPLASIYRKIHFSE